MAEQQYYNKDKVHGFYYDHQMMNPLFTVTLHPNTRAVDIKNNDLVWENSPVNGTDKFGIKHYDDEWDQFFTDGFSSEPGGGVDGYLPIIPGPGDNNKYFAEPICSSIFSEDFMFSLNNEWSSFDGGNAIENIFKNFKGYAPMVGALTKGAKQAAKSMEGLNGFGSGLARALTSGIETVGDITEQAEQKLNKALYIQGTRYTLYNGTSTHFGNMSMKFTLLSDWKQKYPDPKGGEDTWEFQTVYDQLRRIWPYAQGLYRPEREGLGWLWEKTGKSGVTKAIDDFIADYAGWQSPPGGYMAETKNINTTQKGTLRLILGGYYTIDNLLIKNWTVNLSRQLCKNPKKDPGPKEEMVPLYADVQIDLMPAGVYTDAKLDQFMNQGGMASIIKAITPPKKKGSGTEEGGSNNNVGPQE